VLARKFDRGVGHWPGDDHAFLAAPDGNGGRMEDRLLVAREQREPPIVRDVGHRGPACDRSDRGGWDGCHEPHQARPCEDTGNSIARERSHGRLLGETMNDIKLYGYAKTQIYGEK